MIRLVTFDALHTLISPRLPIFTQYAQVFQPYLGELHPNNIKTSFKSALKQLQSSNPSYSHAKGADGWWAEVIERTAVGAGGDEAIVKKALPYMVPRLLKRFGSKQGYRVFDDTLPVRLISNTDSRMRLVLQDLALTPYLSPIILSDEVSASKPSKIIYDKALSELKLSPALSYSEVLHVGDDLVDDYHGAKDCGMHSALIRRQGSDGEGESKEIGEILDGVTVVDGLMDVIGIVSEVNRNSK